MADSTARIGLPYVVQNQAQKEVTINQCLDIMDFYTGPVVKSFLATLPDSPSDGDAYVLTGTVHPNYIAHRVNGAWEYYAPFDGCRILNNGDAIEYIYTNNAWTPYSNADAGTRAEAAEAKALEYKNAAATSETNAGTSATNAANSETNAAKSATDAATNVSNAITANIATEAEATAGEVDNKIMTPLKVVKWFISKIATAAQAIAGTDDATVMTPLKVKNAIDNMGLTWVRETDVAAGKTIYDPDIALGCVVSCTIAGKTGTTKPTFSGVAMGGTVTDGTVVWTVMASEYIYDEGTGYTWKKHFNPNTGLWVNEITEWGVSGGYNWKEITLALPLTANFLSGYAIHNNSNYVKPPTFGISASDNTVKVMASRTDGTSNSFYGFYYKLLMN